MIKYRNGSIIISRDIPEYVFLAVFSFFAFSKWSTYICSNIIGFRFNVYEIVLIPFIIYYRKSISQFIRYMLNSNGLSKIMVYFCLALFFMLFGCVINPNAIVYHIASYRTVFYYIFIINYFSQVKTISLGKIQTVSSFAVIGDFIYLLTMGKNESQLLINPVALCITIILPIVNCKIVMSIFISAFCLVASFRSAYRFSIMIVLFSIVFSIIAIMIEKKNKKALLVSTALFVMFFVLISNLNTIVEKLVSAFNMSNWSASRVTERIMSLFNQDYAIGDINRINSFYNYPNYFNNSFIPRGLFRGSIGEIGWYTDVPVMYLLDAFGTIATVLIVLVFVIHSAKTTISFFKYKNKVLAMLFVMVPNFIIMFLLNGTFLYWHYVVIISALIFGLSFNNRINHSDFITTN